MNRLSVWRAALAAFALAFLLDSAMAAQKSRHKPTTQEQPEKPSDQPGEKTITIEVPVLMMAPVKILEDAEKQGCWARLYAQDGFRGDRFTLIGPVAMTNLRGPFGQDWENKIESIETGPRAAVTLYANENFKDRSAQVAADKKVPDMSEKAGLFDHFKSLRIDCS